MKNWRLEKERAGVEGQFAQPAWLEETGLPLEQLKVDCKRIWDEPGQSIGRRRARAMAYALDHAQIALCEQDLFADQLRVGRVVQELTEAHFTAALGGIAEELDRTDVLVKNRAFTGEQDFGHTCPDWRAMLELGFGGLLARLREKKAENVENAAFYEDGILVMEAVLRYIGRLSDAADKLAESAPRMAEVAQELRLLRVQPPQTLYQALEMISLAYFVQQSVEGTILRSLGRMDLLVGPIYEKEMAEGRITRQEAKRMLQCWLCRWDAQKVIANIPITLGGTDEAGRAVDTGFASLLVETYGELDLSNIKFQIRVSVVNDEGFLHQVMRLVRTGSNSFVFCNDEVVEEALRKLGQTAQDARDYVMVGCYEASSMGREVACTCSGRLSIPKAVEYALSGGIDLFSGQRALDNADTAYATYEAFTAAVKEKLRELTRACMQRVLAIEELYPQVYAAPFFSSTLRDCVEKGVDAYAGGAKYNNTSVCAFGLATAVDAMLAVKKVVFEDRRVTLTQLADILRCDWQGEEGLRLLCEKRAKKYGVGDKEADDLAAELMAVFAGEVNNVPNSRGGMFRAGGFSVDWRMGFGRVTAASADGRHAKEPLSKNLSASAGQDAQGVTALIRSATRIDCTALADGAVLDIVLHESAVRGAEGLDAMMGLLRTFIRQGGLALQCNVLDAGVLRAAQAQPSQYPNLQVRLCGWNVRFVDLSRKEQDELILQAESA